MAPARSPASQGRVVVALELDVELGKLLAQIGGRPEPSKRVVFVQDRHAEHRHDRVTDELLDRAPVTLDHASCELKVWSARHGD